MKCKNCVRHVHLNDDGERTVGTPNWCFYLSDSPDEELERDCIAFKSLTNADRIRSMTDEELAEWIEQLESPKCPCDDWFDRCEKWNCNGYWLDWLKEEVTANDS